MRDGNPLLSAPERWPLRWAPADSWFPSWPDPLSWLRRVFWVEGILWGAVVHEVIQGGQGAPGGQGRGEYRGGVDGSSKRAGGSGAFL